MKVLKGALIVYEEVRIVGSDTGLPSGSSKSAGHSLQSKEELVELVTSDRCY